MPKFRKKPIVIDAWQIPNNSHDCEELVAEVRRRYDDAEVQFRPVQTTPPRPFSVLVVTLEGTMIAWPGAWLIRGVKGEFYPCDDEVFRASYEEA